MDRDTETSVNETGPFLPGKEGPSPQAVAGSNRPEQPPKPFPAQNRLSSLLQRQVLAAAGPVMFTIGSGMTSGFSAVLLPQLTKEDSSVPISSEEASWIASMAALPMAAGCLAGGFLMERAGRRWTSLLICLPALIGWPLMAAAFDLRLLLVGRFLTGFAVGAFGPVGLVYIGETSSPQYRGVLLAATALAVSLGIFISHILGAALEWRTAAGLCSIAPALATILIFISPESPAWLAARGRTAQAEEIFCWLRGSGPEASSELRGLLAQAQAQQNVVSREPISRLLLKPSFFKPFLFMNVFFFVQQFSGVNAVAFYTVDIFKQTLSTGGSTVNEYVAMAILDVARLVMSIIACVLLRRLGRRPLALTSAVGTAASLLTLAAFLHFGGANLTTGAAGKLASWAPVLFLVLYMAFVSVGLVPLPWVMTGEVFPAAVRGIGSGATSCIGFLAFFAVVKSGPAMFAALGAKGAFLVYGIIASAGGVYLYFFCPETKNKTLQDIENNFNRPKQSVKY